MRRHTYLSIDLALIGAATVGAFVLRDTSFRTTFDREGLEIYLALSVFFGGICMLATGTSSRVWRYFSLRDALRIFMVAFLTVSLTWSVTFMIDRADLIPRAVPLLQLATISLLLIVARFVVRMVLEPANKRGRTRFLEPASRHCLIIGANEVAEFYIRRVERLSLENIAIEGILDEDPSSMSRLLRSIQVLGSPANIHETVNSLAIHGININRIVVAVPFNSLSEKSREALRAFEKVSGLSLDLFEDRLGISTFEKTSNVAAPVDAGSDVVRTGFVAQKRLYPTVKRAIDIAAATVLIAVTAPLILLVWALVLFDVGAPAYFWQIRPGYQGHTFRLMKFRTMRGAHDARGRRIPDDERSTFIGAALRRYRLDEFPQFFNILKGDMSFIGPRPLLPIDQPKDATLRLSVRPGLTGWAQVNGGRSLSNEDKAMLDAWYVQNASFKLDLDIAWRTIIFVISGEKPVEPDILSAAHRNFQELTAPGRRVKGA